MNKLDKGTPLVSVIIPIYNVEKYLSRCLDSVINQSFKDIEIIIVNDGSTDSSLAIAKKYVKKDSRIKIINQLNKGPGSARNVGILNATSNYIIFIDSDDTINKKMIELLYNQAVDTKSDIVSCQYNRVDENCVLEISPIERYTKDTIIDFMSANISPMVWNKIYKKNLFEEYNIFFPEQIRLCEDHLVSFKLFLYSKNHTTIDKPLYNWYNITNSLTNYISKKHIEDLFKIYKDIQSYLMKEGLYLKYKNIFYGRIIYIVTTHILNKLYTINSSTNTLINKIQEELVDFDKNIFKIVKQSNYSYYINYFYTLFKVSITNNIKLNRKNNFLEYINNSKSIVNLDSRILIELVKKREIKDIIIYGTGKISKDIMKYLNSDIKVLSILDSNKEATFYSHEVYTLDTVPIDLNHKNIIVASVAYADQIIKSIDKYAKNNNLTINTISICDIV